MNWEAKKAQQAKLDEIKKLGGMEAYRLHALRNLRVKTVVKESHCSSVHALAFNHTQPELHNLFATVGKDQATVYDDEHMADYLGIVVHFANAQTEHTAGGELQACCWLNTSGWTEHPHGDACLAVAGADPNISVISTVEAAVTKLLRGHTKEVIELAAGRDAPRLLLSLSKDGNLRLWDVPTEACLSTLQTDASCIAMAPDGRSFVTGNGKGRLHRYEVGASKEGAAMVLEGSKAELQCQGSSHNEGIDCIRYLPGGRLATKSVDGRMFVWALEGMASTATWKVPSCNGLGGLAARCQFGSTSDGKYISVGNSLGDCYVYDSHSGQRAAHVAPIKVTAPARACGLSDDCRHLVAVLGKGFLFRYEYLGATAAEEDKENGSAENGEPAATGGQQEEGGGEEAGGDE